MLAMTTLCPATYLVIIMLLAARGVSTSSRAPCAWISIVISAGCCFMSKHILSKLDAEIMWHLRSTCHVMGVYWEQISSLRVVPVVEPVYFARSFQYVSAFLI